METISRFAIFDLDGTLLDTIEDLANACNYALEKNGFPPHPVEPYKIFVGKGVYNLVSRCLPEGKADPDTIERVKQDFDAYYTAHSQDCTHPYEGIPQALQTLKDAGVRIGVLSNKPNGYTKILIEEFFGGLADVVFGQRENVPIKPDPTSVHEIIDLMGCQNAKGFYLGDTSTDMQTGKNAGLYTIGVSWGFRTKEELLENGADVIVNKPEEFVRLILDKN